jgi:small subunit ribosomal protein S27e
MTAVRAQFVKAKCPDCSNEQVVFNRASTKVNCLVCGATLATPTGGFATFKAEITQKFD